MATQSEFPKGNPLSGSPGEGYESPSDRQQYESEQALKCFNDYAALGLGRNFAMLLRYYRKLEQEGRIKEVPSQSLMTIKDWARTFKWKQRLVEREARISEMTESQMAYNYIELKRHRVEVAKKVQSAGERLLEKFADRMDELDDANMTVLSYLVPTALRAIELGHKEMRLELGEDGDRDRVTIDKVMAAIDNALPPQLSSRIRESLTNLICAPVRVPSEREEMEDG